MDQPEWLARCFRRFCFSGLHSPLTLFGAGGRNSGIWNPSAVMNPSAQDTSSTTDRSSAALSGATLDAFKRSSVDAFAVEVGGFLFDILCSVSITHYRQRASQISDALIDCGSQLLV